MEYSSFFNSKNGDRKYLAEDWDRHLKDLISNGVFLRDSENLQVTADGSGMTVTVQPGAAWINGKHYLADQAIVLKVDIADGALNRIDRVVVQCSTADRIISAKIKKGTPASTATAPSLQRDADAYELSLATVGVSAGAITIRQTDITDTRLDTAVCGTVVGLITQVGTDTLYAQIQDDLHHFKADREDDFSTWSVAQKSAFAAWLTHIKAELDADAAGHLQNQIDAITDRIPDGGEEHQVAVYGGAPGKLRWQKLYYVFRAKLSVSNWIGTGPYTQTLSIPEATADMDLHIDLVPASGASPTPMEENAFACITGGTTMDREVIIECRDDRPSSEINVRMEVHI